MAHWKRGLSCLRASARYSKRLFSYMRRYRHPALQAAFWLLLLVLLCGPLALSLSDHWVSFPLHGRFWRRGSLARVFSLTQTVTSGVVETTEEQQTAAGMQRINLLNVDLTNTNIRLGVVQA